MQKVTNLGEKCTGCSACLNICGKNAIDMQIDNCGFYKPVINEDLCVGCGICDMICPQINSISTENTESPSCYALWADDEIRMKSSSGGAFTLLATEVLQKGGKVYGCAYGEGMKVRHMGIDSLNELSKLRKSKYVESYIGTIYREVENDIKEKRIVLFSGLPCQIAALKAYLGKEYDNLYLVDLVCFGSSPAGIFERYIKEIENKTGKKIVNVDFRNKLFGWRTGGKYACFEFEDGSIYESGNDVYCNGYFGKLLKKEACYECKYCSFPRQGDVTIGDFWGIETVKPEWDDNKGTSFISVNSKKGQKLFDNISVNCKKIEEMELKNAKAFNRFANKDFYADMKMSKEHFYKLLEDNAVSKSIENSINDKYDIGIVGNWTSTNYGAQLTYYALYKTLSDMKKDVVMIERAGLDVFDETSLFIENPYPEYALKKSYSLVSDMKELNEKCDTFVLGSDQLWRYGIFEQHSVNEFMLAFANSDKRKITYATSFGFPETDMPAKYFSKAKYLMNRLQKVSVREKSGVDICKNKFDIQAEQVLDPVFLCNKDHYKELMAKSTVKEEASYIFCYIPYSKSIKKHIWIIENIAKRLDKKIVCVCNVSEDEFCFGDERKLILNEKKCKIEDWLYYLYNSDMVITTSYHGYCFSIIFNKQVIAMFSNGNVLERAASLSERLGIKKPYLLNDFDMEKCLMDCIIDYNAVNQRLENEKQRSKKWLEEALDSEILYDKCDLLWDAIGTDVLDGLRENDKQKKERNRFVWQNRNIVVFGAGLILDEHYKDVSRVASINYIVDNNKEKWGTILYDGIECISPEKLKEIDNPYVIIAIKNEKVVNNIKTQLNGMGIKDIVHIFDVIEKKEK